MKKWLLSKIRKNAKVKFQIEDFDELFLDVYLLTYIIKFLASFFSLLTGFYFLLTIFGAQLEGYAKFILAGITVLMVELIKYYVTPKAFSNLFKKRWNYGMPSLLIALPLYAISIFFTVNGAKKFFEAKNKDISVAEKIKEVRVNNKIAYYDSLIRVEQKKYFNLEKQHSNTRRMGWKAVIEQFKSIELRIDAYLTEKSLTQSEIKREEQNKVEVVIEETNSLKDSTIFISISSELLLFLAFLFGQFFLFRSYKDNLIKVPKETKKIISVKINVPLLGTVIIKK